LDSKYVVDSVEKKWVLGWEKSLLTGKMLICGNVSWLFTESIKSILNGLKGITIYSKRKCDELAMASTKQLSVDAFMKKKKLNCCKYINWQNFTCLALCNFTTYKLSL
jgi:ribonuclease HI